MAMPTQWKQDDLTVDGIRLHYHRTGNGGARPLVMIHGFSDNGLCWTPVARDLEAEFDVILPDMRGHGLSERVRPGEAVDMAADLAGLIRALELDRPTLIGHSMGAMVAYQTGLRFPERTGALVLEDPPWWIEPPASTDPSDDSAENSMATWAKSLSGRSAEDLLAQYRREHPAWPEDLLLPMCESKKQLDPRIVDPMLAEIRSPEWNWRTTVRNLARPTLVITGNPALGGIVTPEVIAEIRAANPDVAFAQVPDVGHLIRFDNFPAYREILRAFLRRPAGEPHPR
jgi:N-formylmaleamate deformylase